MAKHQRPNLVYDFAGFSARAPNQQIPGDRLAAQFAEHAGAIVKLQQALEGLDAPITVADLDPKLFREIAKEAKDSLEKLAQDSARAAGRAASSAQQAVNQAAEARDAAKPLLSRAEQILAAERDALAILEEQRIALHVLERKLEDLKAAGPGLQVRTDPVGLLGPNAGGKHSADALGAAATAADYAQVSIHWSEWMGPGGIYEGGPAGASDIIPNNILAINAISGDHWSSRWWAHKAAEYVNGFLYGYYMGPHPQPPIQAIGGGPIPVGSYYFNTSNNVMYVWTGTEWIPFNTPQKASAVSLWYRAGTGQTTFPLTVPDLFGQSIPGLDPAGTQPIEVHLRGELLLPTSGPVTGDYFVDYATSVVEFAPAPVQGSLVAIDVLIDPDTLAPGAVKVIKLRDFNFDGVRTTFSLIDQFTGQPVIAAAASQLFVVLDGVDQEPGVDFALGVNGDTITFMEAPRADAKSYTMFFEAAGGVAGQIYHDDTLVGDGSQLNPLSVVQQVVGAFDADTGVATFTAMSGLPGTPGALPPASSIGIGKYLVVHEAGTPASGPPETQVYAEVGDWWISDGTLWHLLRLGSQEAQIATETELGLVRVPARNKHSQGLDIDLNGFLFAPPATHEHLGTITEPQATRQLHARVRDGVGPGADWEAFEPGIGDVSDTVNVYGRTNSRWIQLQPGGTFPPASMLYVQINGDTMQGPLYLHAEGALALEAVTVSQLERVRIEAGIGLAQIGQRIDLKPASDLEIGGITEAPDDGVPYVRQFQGWEKLPDAASPLTFDRGLTEDNDRVSLDIATDRTLGGVVIAPQPGLFIDQTGNLTLERATPEDLGGLVDAPRDDTGKRLFARQWGQWKEIEGEGGMEEPPAEPVGMWGRTSAGARGWALIDQTGALIAGNTPTETGVIYVPDDRGLNLSPDGAVTLRPAGQYPDLGGMFEAPLNDGPYVRDNGQWAKLPEAASDFVTVGRSPIQALDEGFDDVLQKRSLFVPLATDFLAGAIVEPPADGAQYARTNDAANGPVWVENIAKGVHTDDAPPMTPSDGALWWKSDTGALYVFYEDIDSGQWVQVNGTPSPDATISTGDTPPSNPRPNQLWFESDRGSLFFWYADADSSQWVEILGGSGGTAGSAPPVDLTGYATEAWTTDQIANAVIDAQAFVTAAAEKQAGHDTDLCQQALKAVEGLAVSVKQLQKGHLALKARIQKLEAR